MPRLDVLTVSRFNLDFYAQQTWVEFPDVTSWVAMVGGSPASIAIAATRLGPHSALLSAVGNDLVGDGVLTALGRQQVSTG